MIAAFFTGAFAIGAFSLAYREHFGEAGSGDYLGQTPILVSAFDALLNGLQHIHDGALPIRHVALR